MKIFESIKNFKEFAVGAFVVKDNCLFQISGLPVFRYRLRFTNGEFEDYFTEDFSKVESSDWQLNGYGIRFIKDNKLDFGRSFIFAEFEAFNSEIHPKLVPEFNKFQLLLAKKELEEKIRNS